MLNRVASIEAIGPAAPQHGAVYPNNSYGRQLRDVAHIIRSGLGLEVATVDIGDGIRMMIKVAVVASHYRKERDWQSFLAGSWRSITI
jgi:hypothetical protein